MMMALGSGFKMYDLFLLLFVVGYINCMFSFLRFFYKMRLINVK